MFEKRFDFDLINKISEICDFLLKTCNEDVKPNKLVEKFENCSKHINTLLQIQKDYSFISVKKIEHSNEMRLNNCQKLIENFRKKGLISKLSILESKSGKGLGLYSDDLIDKYDLTISVPIDQMITEHETYLSKFGLFLMSNQLTKKMPNLSLSLYLLNECLSECSVHQDYINCLPFNVDNFLYMQIEDIKLLQHSQYLSEIIQQFCLFCCHYCNLFRVLSVAETVDGCWFKNSFCFEDFRWAISVIMSRNNYIPSTDGKSKMLALIPVWDMMNHKLGEVTTDFDIENQSLLFYSMCSYQINDEVCMDYGKRSNFHYFLYSGFIPDYNAFDTYHLKIGFNRQDSFYRLKQQILMSLSINCDNPTITVDYSVGSNMSDSILSFYLAIMLCKDGKCLEAILNSENIKEEIIKYAKLVWNDVKRFLKVRLEISINSFNKSLDQSNAMISSDLQSLGTSLLVYEKKVMKIILEKLN